MAEAIISPIAEVLIVTLGSAAVEEIKALWNVEAELEDLEETIKTVKAVLVDAQKRQIREEQVRVWLERLEDAIYLADDFLDEISTKGLQRQLMMREKKNIVKRVCTLFSCCNTLASRHVMAGKIEEVRSELDKIAADRRDFHFVENMREEVTNAARRSGRETRSFVLREDVIGRDADKREILKLLLETNTHGEEVSVIPIVGMGGLGKTRLAQLVFNDESVQRHFDPKIWVCVSDFFDERLIIEKMLKIAFEEETKNLELEQLQNKLRKNLVGKRYLLVLDDVWNDIPQKWKSLKELLMSFAEGSRIIVTTRSKNVANVMRTRIQPHDLGILDPKNSWSLFKKVVFEKGQEQINPTIEEVGKEIVKKCGGVPLAIWMIGGMLPKEKPETYWPSFLHKELSNLPQKENDILPTLKLSYDCLPSHLKHCFAYCRLFPKDYKIDVQTLVTLWIAQGFIQHPSQSLEEIGYAYFMELFSRSFFQEDERDEFDKVKRCKMHDLVHDLAIQVAGEGYVMLNLREESNHKKIRHVSFEFSLSSSNEVPSSLLQAKRLRSILLPNQEWDDIEREQGESICDLIASNFKFLRMLDLHDLGIKILPNSIGKLKHLRYLDLSNNEEMEALPSCITELVNLQTLKLNECSELNELPRDINKLVNLRHLEFNSDEGIGISQMPRGLGQLTKLQTISYFVLSNEGTNLGSRGSELDELEGLNNLTGELEIRGLRGGLETEAANLKEKKNLRSLCLQWDVGNVNDSSDVDDESRSDEMTTECDVGDVDDASSSDEKTIEGLKPHTNLRELKLEYYGGVRLSGWLLPSLTNLVNLVLFDCRNCRQLPPLSQFPSLKRTSLLKLPCLEYITNDDVDVGGTNFWTSLQVLQMSDLPGLKGWWRLPVENQVKLPSFPRCFSELTISDCPELSCMPLYPTVENLHLESTSWRAFEETAALKAEDEASSSSSSSSPLSKLTDLRLQNVVDLPESLPNWMKSLTSLKKLRIDDIAKLKYLSPGIQYLTSLQRLEIWDCEELIEIFNGDTVFPFLKNMSLYRLRCLEYITNDNVDVGGTNFWTSLQELDLEDLPSLKGWWRLPGDVAENQVKLPSFPPCLSTLRICDCPELSCMPLYPSVEYLDLMNTSWKTFEETALKAEDEASSSSNSSSLAVVSSSPLSKLRDLVLCDVVDLPESLPNWMKSLTSLKTLRIWKYPKLEYISNEDVGDINLCQSSSCSPTVLSVNIPSFLQRLELIDLPNLKGWWRLHDVAENQVKLPSFPPCLSELTIIGCPRLTCMPLYPNVETLTLKNTSWKTFEETALKAEDEASSSSSSSAVSPLSKLTDLSLYDVVDIPESLPNWMKSLTSLTRLEVSVPKLMYLSPGIQYLTSLQELKIEDCKELIEISKGDSIKWDALSSLRDLFFDDQPNLVTLPKGLQRATTLQSLTIWGCDNFMTVPDWICKLCSLEGLTLCNCPKLKSLPASMRSLASLRSLSIHGCPTLSERCKRPTGEDWPKIQHIPHLYVQSLDSPKMI